MIRLPWAQLSIEVDKLYNKVFDENDIKGINEHCNFIVEFIHAAGWTEEEYMAAYSNNGAVLN